MNTEGAFFERVKGLKRISLQAAVTVTVTAVVALGFLASQPALANPGDLDPTFGNDGKVITNVNRSDGLSALAVQADGKLVGAGDSGESSGNGDFVVAGYDADGTLDGDFGDGGITTTDFGMNWGDSARAMVIQADGKIVAAGRGQAAANRRGFALARYKTNGTLDTTFGDGGKVVTPIGERSLDVALDIELQDDGKLVAAGWADLGPGALNNFVLVRYNENGSLDTSFGNGGKVVTPLPSGCAGLCFEEGAQALEIQADGKLVVVGPASGGPGNYDFALARYRTDGTLDDSFGSGGITFTAVTDSGDIPWDLALQPDGKLVSAGIAAAGPGSRAYDFVLTRHNTDGSLDDSFGAGGKLITQVAGDRWDHLKALTLQDDGKIIGGGTANVANAGPFDLDFALQRVEVNGSLDMGFGTAGIVTTPFDTFGADSHETIEAVAIQQDGAVVVAGRTMHQNNWDDSDIALARYEGGN